MFGNILTAIGLFFIQPTFIVGIVLAILSAQRRLKYERLTMRTAIFREYREVRLFLMGGLVAGLVGSLIALGIGMPFTLDWIILFQIINILLLGMGYRFIHPLFSFSLTTLILASATYLIEPNSLQFIATSWFSPINQGMATLFTLGQSTGILTLVFLLFSLMILKKVASQNYTPHFRSSKRGKIIANYQMKPFWLIPLLLVVPGESFGALFDWWPVFSIGNETFSFFFLPILAGFRYTAQAQHPIEATDKIIKELIPTALISGALLVASYWMPILSLVNAGVVFLLTFIIFYRHRLREREWSFRFGPPEEGVKVIAIRPDTPAAKMGLQIGDTIVVCNNQKVYDADSLYQALSQTSVYCHLKIKQADGELRLAETAVYDDAPHDMGIVTLSQITIPRK
ncbi:PDZ domain-containing protein [Lacticigenium naphthae]|uniref:PDZ domain-containing protein n=1 Tax=Lacticigenium naphthae TaxID=515351 RepID=UPI000408999C|nr:PDZ domain-containing protein [Lacticigenium naphthae]